MREQSIFYHDILVSERTKDEHDDRLRKVCERLKEKGLTLRKSNGLVGQR